MKNIYLVLLSAIILNACSNKKEPSVDEILATNDVAKITSKKNRHRHRIREVNCKFK